MIIGIIGGIVLGALTFVVLILFFRVVREVMIVIFKIAEDVHIITQHKKKPNNNKEKE